MMHRMLLIGSLFLAVGVAHATNYNQGNQGNQNGPDVSQHQDTDVDIDNRNYNTNANSNRQDQGQAQGQGQGQGQKQSNSIHWNDEEAASSAIAPNVMATKCKIPIATAVQLLKVGFSFGSTTADEICELIVLSKRLEDLGYKRQAAQMMCYDKRVNAILCKPEGVLAQQEPTPTVPAGMVAYYTTMSPVPN